jgi:hypothetical protein
MAKFLKDDLDTGVGILIVAAALILFVSVFLFIGKMDSGPAEQQVSQNSAPAIAPGNEVLAPQPVPSEVPAAKP